MGHIKQTINVHFKRWSRKHYAVLKSLFAIIKICFLCVIYTIIGSGFMPLFAQNDSLSMPSSYNIEEIKITGQINPVIFPAKSRMVNLIRHEEITSAPVQSLHDLLENVANIDITQRGSNGVQADVTMRGGSFDHVMILLNGILISDPQTGHFSLDIPLDIEAVQRIEIMNGTAARIYGAGAFSGAVNIVAKPVKDQYCKASLTAGEYGYKKIGLTASLGNGNVKNLVNIGHTKSNGYTHNTDFLVQNVYYSGHYNKGDNSLDIQAGYQQKAFGANGFYSPRYPDQYEENNSSLVSLNYQTGTKIKIKSSAYWKRKQDHYILQRNNPGLYQNYHRNNIFGSNLTGEIKTGKIISSAGIELRSENIISTSLGLESLHPVKVKQEDSLYYSKHYNRSVFSFFQEHQFQSGRLSLTTGYMLNWHSDFSSKPAFFPGIDISFTFTKTLTGFLSINRTFHFPTFTDMFYTDPSHQGNKTLDPDRMISAEVGLHADFSVFRGSIALYKSSGKSIIDWLWLYESGKYSPVNIDHFSAAGIEILTKLPCEKVFSRYSPLYDITIGYNYLDVDKSLPDSISKYYHLKHKVTLSVRNKIFRNINSTWYFCYQDRMGSYIRYNTPEDIFFSEPFKPVFLVDGQLAWDTKRVTFYIEASNLLNTKYVDAGSVIQPGRWIKAGIKANMYFSRNKCIFE